MNEQADSRSLRQHDLALIHLAKRQLDLDDETYRMILFRITGQTSAAELDKAQRSHVIDQFRARGFRPLAGAWRRRGNPRSRYIHFIWNRLVAAGALSHREGLSHWLKVNTRALHPRHTGWARPESLPPAVAGKIINRLKAWAKRADIVL